MVKNDKNRNLLSPVLHQFAAAKEVSVLSVLIDTERTWAYGEQSENNREDYHAHGLIASGPWRVDGHAAHSILNHPAVTILFAPIFIWFGGTPPNPDSSAYTWACEISRRMLIPFDGPYYLNPRFMDAVADSEAFIRQFITETFLATLHSECYG